MKIPMKILRFFKKQKEEETIEELVKYYKSTKFFISMENLGKTSPPPPDSFLMKELRSTEMRIINILTDEFQKSVFKILVKCGFDITEFLEEKNWKEILKDEYKKICHYLYYGSIYPRIPEWPPLPVSGEKFLFSLIKEAGDVEKEKRLEKIFSFLKTEFENSTLLGLPFDWKKNDISMRLIVIFAGEFSKKVEVLIDMLYDEKDGENFVKDLLNLKATV